MLLALVLAVAGSYAFLWWQEGASRAARRSQLLADVQAELAQSSPDMDRLGDLMAGLMMLDDAETAADLLAARAEIELLRGRADRAYRLFGPVADSPSASPAEQRLGARIQLARQDAFTGDAPAAQAMLEQVIAFSSRAYDEGGGAAADAFRAWQACKRLWSHERAKSFAAKLAAAHPDSREHRLVALTGTFDASRDAVAVKDLALDFEDRPVAELAALEIATTLQSGAVPAALTLAEQRLNRFAGVGGVRFALAIVLHACVLGKDEGSFDRATFAARRDEQLAWLEARAPAGEALRAQWLQLRAVR
ncbi:MAG: hypothetical protein ACON4Z_17555 [Planctomycetota bacterium]